MSTAIQDQAELERRQDELRPMRQFMSLVSGLSGEQTYGAGDGTAPNTPGQFSVYGPYGQAIEGQPVMAYNQSTGGVTLSPVLILLGLGAIAFLMLR